MICGECGNQIIRGCGPTCLVCEHTGRVLEQTDGYLAAMDAAFHVAFGRDDVLSPSDEVKHAQWRLSNRILENTHVRERPPNWNEAQADHSQS